MSNYGLTLTGYVTPSPDDIRNDINTLMRTRFGSSLDLGDSDPVGFLIGLFAAALATAYEANQAVWSSIDPDAATGTGLDTVSLITGTFRTDASSSRATETFCGADATVIPAGFTVSTASTGIKFQTTAPIVTSLLTSWAATTGYTVGQRRTTGTHCYVCTVAGTSSASAPTFGPSTTGTYTGTDGSVTWAWIGDGVAVVDAYVYAVDTGPQVAVARDISAIATPIAGVNTAFNIADAILGTSLQTDQGLRLLRAGELALDGDATPNALRAYLLSVSGVTGVNLFYNNTDATDANGTPPHSVNALVQGGADQDIYQALFDSVPVGIGTIGTSIGTVVDNQGVSQTVKFTRAIGVPIYIRASLSKLANTYAGDLNMRTLLAAAGSARTVGSDAIASALVAAAFAGDSSVIDVSSMLIYTDVIGAPVAWTSATPYVSTVGARSVVMNDGRTYICTVGGTSSGSPTGPLGTGSAIVDGTVTWAFLGNTIAIDAFHIATYSAANITVISTDGTL